MIQIESETTVTTIVKNTYHVCDHVNAIEKITNGKTQIYLESKNLPKNIESIAPVLVKNSFFDYIKKHNPFHSYNGLTDHIVADPSLKQVENGKIVMMYTNGHVLFDQNLKILPTIYCFDYIGTIFTSEQADLPKLRSYLLKHKMVRSTSEIHQIPYYNNDSGYDTYIDVEILPDCEVINKIYDKIKSDKFWSCRLKDAFAGVSANFDPLGIHKFRKTNEED